MLLNDEMLNGRNLVCVGKKTRIDIRTGKESIRSYYSV